MPTPRTLLDDLLAPGGAVSRAMGEGFEVRPQQASMCKAVALAMQGRTHLLAEAGTGTGKSFAYLLPAALRAVLHGERVIISTHTISLQEQLLLKDLPVIERVLELLSREGLPEAATEDGQPRALKAVLVKGRGNYVSIRRLKLASERQDKLFADPAAKRSLHVIEDWAYQTRDGTTSSLPPIERWGVWDKVQSDSGNCMGRKCPTYEQCFFQSARRELEDANIMVCNHALFFSDLALRVQDVGFLPRYDHVVFDEAHTVEEVAGEHFGVSLSEGRVQHLLSSLYQPRTGKGFLPQLTLLAGDAQNLDKAIALCVRAVDVAHAFFEDLSQAARRGREGGAERTPRAGASWIQQGARATSSDGGEPVVFRVRTPGVVENGLALVMRDLCLRLRSLREEAKVEADKYELNAYAQRAEMIASDAHALVEQSIPACAYWIELSGEEGAGGRRVTFACAPVEVGPLLKERLFAGQCSVTLTSATLATTGSKAVAAEPGEDREEDEALSPSGGTPESAGTRHAFAPIARQLGCEGAATLMVGSPFDYRTQAEVYVERVGGSGARGGAASRHEREGQARALAQHTLRHLRETQGGAFVLFTSFAMLRKVASLIERDCARMGLPLLVQGRDGSRTAILQRFRESEHSVLLGAASFWQGVDVRGRALRNVIITKLPFDPPDRPLVQARGELIASRGGNPFMEDALPRAVLRFKQGFGRLIRSKDDHGRVVILDDRVLTTRYGRLFLEALPEGVPIRIAQEERDDAHDPMHEPPNWDDFPA